MIQKIKITMVEFKEVKVFNPLKFWKGRQIVEQFIEKNTQQFVFNDRLSLTEANVKNGFSNK